MLGILRALTRDPKAGRAAFCKDWEYFIIIIDVVVGGRLVFLVRRRLHFLEGHTRTQRTCEVRQCVLLLLLLLSAAYLQPTSTTSFASFPSFSASLAPRSLFMSFCCMTATTIHALGSLHLSLSHACTFFLRPSLSVLAVCSTLCRIWYHRIPISV